MPIVGIGNNNDKDEDENEVEEEDDDDDDDDDDTLIYFKEIKPIYLTCIVSRQNCISNKSSGLALTQGSVYTDIGSPITR